MTESINHLYAEYLEHSLRYYCLDLPVITDEEFDNICKTLLIHWDEVTHKLKDLTDKGALEAGTGYHIAPYMLPPKFVDLVREYPDQRLKDVFVVKEKTD